MSIGETGQRTRRPRILNRRTLLDRTPLARRSVAADIPVVVEQDPATDDLLLDVESGTLLGRRDGPLRTWRGIPYAAAPVGDLRFRAPRPAEPWDGVRDATEFGPIAPQPMRRRSPTAPAPIPIDEDCLTANVQTPLTAADVAAGTALPVMVFIHGGGYTAGSSRSYLGRSFTSTGRTVYVSFNYRLGPFGYLDFTRYSTDEHPIESNLGLRDQVALLEWVQRNIARFGGDPANVTIFGESAGGGAVTALLGLPSARGLFARAIAQSPPPSAVFPASLAAEWAEEFVGVLRASGAAPEPATDDASELIRSADVADLIGASQVLQHRTPDEYPGSFCFAPTVDGDFVPEHPMIAVREGRGANVPLIIGTNAREGAVFRGPLDILPTTAPRIGAMFGRAPSLSKRAMHDAYPGLPKRHDSLDFGGDYGFWYPSTLLADWNSRHAPTWSYRFDFAPRLLKITGIDATHGVELFTLFDLFDSPLVRAMTALGGRDAYARIGGRMRNAWMRFAESGTSPDSWPAYDESTRSTLIIDESIRVEQDPRRRQRLAWKAFLPVFEHLW